MGRSRACMAQWCLGILMCGCVTAAGQCVYVISMVEEWVGEEAGPGHAWQSGVWVS